MDGKVNFKTILVVGIMLLVVVLGVVGVNTAKVYFSGATAGINPENVKAVADGDSIQITWTTKKETKGYVEYGTSTAAMLIRTDPELEATLNHEIVISQFKSGVAYYFRIREGSDEADKNQWEVFDNGGIPFMFNVGTAVPTETVPVATIAPAVTPVSCDGTTDYNNDGVVNSLDLLACRQGTGSSAGSAATSSANSCDRKTDYNGDGVINSLDMLKCLQSH